MITTFIILTYPLDKKYFWSKFPLFILIVCLPCLCLWRKQWKESWWGMVKARQARTEPEPHFFTPDEGKVIIITVWLFAGNNQPSERNYDDDWRNGLVYLSPTTITRLRNPVPFILFLARFFAPTKNIYFMEQVVQKKVTTTLVILISPE